MNKTGYCLLCIILTARNIMQIYPVFKCPAAFCSTVVGSENTHMQQMKFQFLYLWNVFFCEILLLMFLVTQVIFMCILQQYWQSSSIWNTIICLFVCGMDIAREQYSVKNDGKHEIILLDICLLYLYLTHDWVEQYLGIYHKNVTQISSMASHDVQRYRDNFLPWPCLQQYCKYDNHEAVLHSYRVQNYDWIFHQTFCFTHCDFYL